MKQSQQVLEWQKESRMEGFKEGFEQGKILGVRDALVGMLFDKFGSLPTDLSAAIEESTELDELFRWIKHTVKAASLNDFRAATGI